MKKIFIFLGILIVLSGCTNIGKKDVVSELNKKIKNSKSYHMTATLDIYRNEEKYTYDVESSYKKGDLYKVNLINKNNNHEQIILKNNEGVYVLTPSLNKSFKFQSDWPYNNSQIYLLQPIMLDIQNDKNTKTEKSDDGYIITSNVNYTTEKDFSKQKVYVDSKNNILKVEVLDKTDNVKMSLNIINIDYDTTFDEKYFESSSYYNEETTEKDNDTQSNQSINETSSKIEDIVYPMYVPIDTYLTSQDVVETSSGERVILTFSGESSFTVVQETLADSNSINYVYGDPYLILDTVGSITDTSISWISNGVEYSVISDIMNVDELLTVAQSIGVEAVGK